MLQGSPAPLETAVRSAIERRRKRLFDHCPITMYDVFVQQSKVTMFEMSSRAADLKARLSAFMDEHIYPNEERFFRESEEVGAWGVQPIIEELKPLAKSQGLWNLFLPDSEHGRGLTNLDYAPLCELMGRSQMAPEVFNCSAPDTGNMEVLARYGTAEQQERWLKPLLAGEIRSAFAMTEPAVASSDATNIESSIRRDGDEYVINGRKWYTTGATDPRCKIIIFMGKTDPDNPDRYRQQSMVLVPKETPGVSVVRSIPVFGFYGVPDRASEVKFTDVRVPGSNILLGDGRGFEIAQGRLGPGRIHHCMRLIGLAERTLEKMCARAQSRVAFGKAVSEQTVTQERIAESRILIEQARLLTLHAAEKMDRAGNKAARAEIAMIKVAVPNMACKVVDWAIQIHGGGGTSNDFGLASAYATARLLRIADGPDEVHRNQIARLELRRHAHLAPRGYGNDRVVTAKAAPPKEIASIRQAGAN
jgi:acyl-CoA dehydrogenase